MKTQIQNLGTDEIIIRNRSVKRSYLVIHAVAESVATALTSSAIGLDSIRIDLKLDQAGKSIKSSFNAAPSVVRSVVNGTESGSAILMNGDGKHCRGSVVKINTISTAEEAVLVVPLTDTPIILKGRDQLCINIDLLSGHFGTECDATSKVYLVYEDGSDLNQFDMVLPVYKPITSEKNDGVISAKMLSQFMVIDTVNTTTLNYTKSCVNSVEIDSKYYKERHDQIGMVADKINEKGHSDALKDGCNYDLLNIYPSALESVSINYSVDTSKVVSGTQYLYYLAHEANTAIAKKGQERVVKVHNLKLRSRGVLRS